MIFMVNQNLLDGWGGFYFSGCIFDYWNCFGIEKQYQVSYNNLFGCFFWLVSVQCVYMLDSFGYCCDDCILFNFSYLLWFGDNCIVNLMLNILFNNLCFVSLQIGINGLLDSENNFNYGVLIIIVIGGQYDVVFNGSYCMLWIIFNGSYSQGEGYCQSGIGVSGMMIVYSGGVVFLLESGLMMVLIEVKDVVGVMFLGLLGICVDSNGYVILLYLCLYWINVVEIDLKGSYDDVVFDCIVVQVVLWEGSVVKVVFGIKVQNNFILQVCQVNYELLLFVVSIFFFDGKEIGVVGQGSMMFISDVNVKCVIVKWSGGQCLVDLGQ